MRARAHRLPRPPVVSLLMPVWNPRRAWLLEAVESALGQQGCTVELIVVDDGCAEPVADLLADVDDQRLRTVRIEHGGTSRACTAGFATSVGEWVRYVACDDVLTPDGTAHLLELAGGQDVLAYGATDLCDDGLSTRSTMVCGLQGHVLTECLLNRFDVCVPALLFPRAVVERVGDWDPSIVVCQDWDFVLRALEHAPVRGDGHAVYRYRQHASSASAGLAGSEQSHRLSEEGMRLVVARYFERHPEQRGTALERKANAQVELVQARAHRESYLAYLGRARQGDVPGVLRELVVFARLVISRAVGRLLRPGRQSREA